MVTHWMVRLPHNVNSVTLLGESSHVRVTLIHFFLKKRMSVSKRAAFSDSASEWNYDKPICFQKGCLMGSLELTCASCAKGACSFHVGGGFECIKCNQWNCYKCQTPSSTLEQPVCNLCK